MFRFFAFNWGFGLFLCVPWQSTWEQLYPFLTHLLWLSQKRCRGSFIHGRVHMFLNEPDHRPFEQWVKWNSIYARDSIFFQQQTSFETYQNTVVGPAAELLDREHFQEQNGCHPSFALVDSVPKIKHVYNDFLDLDLDLCLSLFYANSINGLRDQPLDSASGDLHHDLCNVSVVRDFIFS